jgi:hypothetical protein
MKSALPKSLRGSGGGHRTTANSSGSSGPGGGGSGGSGGSRHSRLSSVASLSPSSLSGWSCVCNRYVGILAFIFLGAIAAVLGHMKLGGINFRPLSASGNATSVGHDVDDHYRNVIQQVATPPTSGATAPTVTAMPHINPASAPNDNIDPTSASTVKSGPLDTLSTPTTKGEYIMEHVHAQLLVETITTNAFGINYIWSPAAKSVPLQGVVLLLHGCSAHHLYAWFPNSPACSNCSGRPMEAGIIRELYMRGYATVSTEPFNSKCWSDSKDVNNVGKILMTVYGLLHAKVKDVPLYGLGVANGAKFIINMAGEAVLFGGVPMAGVVCLNGGLWEKPSPVRYYSPILFIDMAKNVDLCMQNNLTVARLKALGRHAEQFTLLPEPFTPTFFSDALVLNEDDSRLLYKNLLEEEVIWPRTHILIDSPFSHMSYKFKEVNWC